MSELDDRTVKCDPNGPVMLMATPANVIYKRAMRLCVSEVICCGLCLIAISVQSVSCLFLTFAAPKGGRAAAISSSALTAP